MGGSQSDVGRQGRQVLLRDESGGEPRGQHARHRGTPSCHKVREKEKGGGGGEKERGRGGATHRNGSIVHTGLRNL